MSTPTAGPDRLEAGIARVRVALVDDEELVCRYLRRILEAAPDIEVTGYALDGDEALGLIARTAPDVAIVDIRMPGTDGIAALAALRTSARAPAVLMLTGFSDDRAVLRAVRGGAAGYLMKSTPPADLVALVRLAAAGYRVFGDEAAVVLGGSAGDPAPDQPTQRIGALTRRERDVLLLLGDGLANADIADRLDLAEGTVKMHVSSVLGKTGCTSRLQAGLLAQRLEAEADPPGAGPG